MSRLGRLPLLGAMMLRHCDRQPKWFLAKRSIQTVYPENTKSRNSHSLSLSSQSSINHSNCMFRRRRSRLGLVI